MSPSFQAFLFQVRSAPLTERSALVDAFMQRQSARGFPDIEQSHVHFLYRGTGTDRVALTGDHVHWSQTGEEMHLLEGTNLYFLGKRFDLDARLDYKFVVNDRWIIDPLNPLVSAGGFGLNSELRMPKYTPAPELMPLTAGPGGLVKELTVQSNSLHASRRIAVYVPDFADEMENALPVVFFNDGTEYLHLAKAKNILDNLIAQDKIAPVIGVFVPPGNREQEFRTSRLEAYSKFLISEVIPTVAANWNISGDPSLRAVVGASDGGYAALWLALSFPEVFGMAGTQSATITERLQTRLSTVSLEGRKFALDCGRYDLAGFLEHHNEFIGLLRGRGGNVFSAEWNDGHSWGNWRAHLGGILRHLFPVS